MENNNAVALRSKVASIKIIARDILRSKMIARALSVIYDLEGKIKDQDSKVERSEKRVIDVRKNLARAEYALSIVDPKNPDAEEISKDLKEQIEDLKGGVERAEKAVNATREETKDVSRMIRNEIKEVRETISKIESGEIKVSKDDLAALVDVLILEAGINSLSASQANQ